MGHHASLLGQAFLAVLEPPHPKPREHYTTSPPTTCRATSAKARAGHVLRPLLSKAVRAEPQEANPPPGTQGQSHPPLGPLATLLPPQRQHLLGRKSCGARTISHQPLVVGIQLIGKPYTQCITTHLASCKAIVCGQPHANERQPCGSAQRHVCSCQPSRERACVCVCVSGHPCCQKERQQSNETQEKKMWQSCPSIVPGMVGAQ